MNRGIIKWRPFNSVSNTKEMLNDANNNNNLIKMPSLSEEQLDILEQKIILNFYTQKNILIEFYKTGKILKIYGKIKKIDSVSHTITVEHTTLFFNQIINIRNQ